MKKSYRTKPAVIEAMQWDGTTVSASEIRSVFGSEIRLGQLLTDPPTACLSAQTPEGQREIKPGDYIAKGIKGEIFVCPAELFEASYEEVIAPNLDSDQHLWQVTTEEYDALREKLTALRIGINTTTAFQRLSATEKTLLRAQESVMAGYHGILKQRLDNATYFQSEALTNLLIAYAEAVRGITRDGKKETHEQVLALYRELTEMLPAEDPRLKTVEQLKGLLDWAVGSCE